MTNIGLSLLLCAALAGSGGSTENDKPFRILGLFPHPGLSHFNVFNPIMRKLAVNGNDVTVVSYFEDKNPLANYHHVLLEGMEVLTNSVDLSTFQPRSFLDNYREFFELASWGRMKCETTLHSSALTQVLAEHKRRPFDLVITEIFDSDCMLGVIHMMKLPFVGLSSCALMPWHYDRLGLPDSPAFIPSESVAFSEKMTYPERLVNWVVTKSLKIMYRLIEIEDNKLLRAKFGDSIPDVHTLSKQMSLLLLNQHFSLSGARPLVPPVIEIGGIHIQAEQQKLPQDIQEFLDSAVDGAIFISWGSVLKLDSLPEDKLNAMLNALKSFPHKVLLKWENGDLKHNESDKLLAKKWLPQKDILCHPNVKLFFAHGGLLGLSEAVYCNVPTVVTPFYGDQFLNAAAVQNRDIGALLEYHEITEATVYEAVQYSLSKRVSNNLRVVSKSFKNRPNTPLETAIWWIMFVLNDNDGSSVLLTKSAAIELSWFAYNSYDAILTICCLIALIIICVYTAIKKCLCNKIIKGQHISNEPKPKTN